jgi:hypothetical protein
MKTRMLVILAAGLLLPIFAAAQPAKSVEDVAQDKIKNDATKQDIQENVKEIASDEVKLKSSHSDEKQVMDSLAGKEKTDVAATKKDGTLNHNQKKAKITAIHKAKKKMDKAVGEQSRADRKPIEKDVRLDKDNIKDDQKQLDNAQAPVPTKP